MEELILSFKNFIQKIKERTTVTPKQASIFFTNQIIERFEDPADHVEIIDNMRRMLADNADAKFEHYMIQVNEMKMKSGQCENAAMLLRTMLDKK